uniref:non-specific serine/threonine protein kinase n=1 Tax=Fundulus heteroclitus TaxID=8078 RepID=A0A3Q2NW58_FUNHE
MAPPRKRTLPKPLPDGFILADAEKKKWRLGKILGEGGFGLIYLASQDVSKPVAADADFVIKVVSTGLEAIHKKLRLAHPILVYQKHYNSNKLLKTFVLKTWLPLTVGLIPLALRYRFMVMDRLGSDLQKVCERNGGRLKKTTVLQLGQRLLDVLEYIHENEYVHADIKAANLMLGCRHPEQVYLADYGLSYRYCPDGVHKEYKENPKKGHNGTIEYTSLDAHKGVAPSRRGDLQILGFCLLHWLCGSLPWDNVLKNPTQVQEDHSITHPPPYLTVGTNCFSSYGSFILYELAEFMVYVRTLDYEDKPDYQLLKELLACDVTGGLDFSVPEDHQGSCYSAASQRKLQSPFTVMLQLFQKQQKGGAARGPRRAKPGTPELDDEEPESAKSKPVPARFIRGPPLTKSGPKEVRCLTTC